jgi:hypothetical protein
MMRSATCLIDGSAACSSDQSGRHNAENLQKIGRAL